MTNINIGDYIYIKKYMGNTLEPDTKKIYTVVQINKHKYQNTGSLWAKKAFLNNGHEQLIYTYDLITKERTYYVEKIPYYKTWFCCI